MPQEPTAIQREDAVPSASQRALLERSKARAAQNADRPRPGDELRQGGTPSFADVREIGKRMQPAPGSQNPPPQALSPATVSGLQAVAAATEARVAQPEPAAPAPAADLGPETVADLLSCDLRTAARVVEILYPEKDLGPDARARKAVEARLRPLDIGQFLMNGVLTQVVQIMPPSESLRSGLVVEYQTSVDGVEAYMDRLLGDEAARTRTLRVESGERVKDVDTQMTEREYVRRTSELALVVGVRSYMGNTWPALTKQSGDIDEAAVKTRLANVRQIPTAVMQHVGNNLRWFLDRVEKTLDSATLGNG